MIKWIPVENLRDDDIIPRGIALKFLPTDEGVKIGNYIPKEGLIYILVDLPGEFMCLSCISSGEEGNTMSYLKKHKNGVISEELKRKTLDKIQKVLICFDPKYEILER